MRTSNQGEKDLGAARGGVMNATPGAGTRPGALEFERSSQAAWVMLLHAGS